MVEFVRLNIERAELRTGEFVLTGTLTLTDGVVTVTHLGREVPCDPEDAPIVLDAKGHRLTQKDGRAWLDALAAEFSRTGHARAWVLD